MSSLFKKKPKPPKPPKPVKSTTKPPELPRPRKPSNQVSDDDEHEYLQPDDWITPSPSKGNRKTLLDTANLAIACGSCGQEKELRSLPCHHSLCCDCINHLIIVGKRDKKSAKCSFCKHEFEAETADNFYACMYEDMRQQEIKLLSDALERDKKSDVDMCDTKDCQRPIDMQCQKCIIFICYRCSNRTICRINDNKHKEEAIDFDDRLVECREFYSQWRAGRKNKVLAIDHEKKKIQADIHTTGTKLAQAPLSTLGDYTQRVLSELSSNQRLLQDKDKEIAEIGSVVKFFEEHIEKLSEIEFVKLMTLLNRQAKITIKSIHLLDKTELIKGQGCERLGLAPDGHIIVSSGYKAAQLAKSESPKMHGSINIGKGNMITGMQTYQRRLYITITNHLDAKERTSSILAYDDMYQEVQNIRIDRTDLYGLAVTDDMIYANDYSNCQYQLYTTQGVYKKCLVKPWGKRLKVLQSGILLIGEDEKLNVVQAYDCKAETVLWSCPVERPYALYLDEYENIWAWSDYLRGFAVISPEGKKLHEICDTKLDSIGDINDCVVYKSELWLAYYGGLIKINIGYY